MSLSNALSISLAGLTATSTAAQTTTENIANAATPGYAKRSISQVSGSDQSGSAGVRVLAIQRAAAESTTMLRRNAEAQASAAAVLAEGSMRLSEAVGEPTDVNALSARLFALETAFTTLSATAESSILQQKVVAELELVSAKFRDTSQSLGSIRENADRAIATDVNALNDALESLHALNTRLTRTDSAGRDVNTLIDQRNLLIDKVNSIVPVRVIPREGEQVSLYTIGGRSLLDARPAELSFSPSPVIGPTDRVGGNLSALLLDGQPLTSEVNRNPLRGGSLIAAFEIRDVSSVAALEGLDALAADLASRLQLSDASLAAGQPGLLTDLGLEFDTVNLDGFASRITLNPLLASTGSAEFWRVRDGAGALAEGAAADPEQVVAFASILRAQQVPVAATALVSGSQDVTALSADLSSALTAARLRNEERQTMLTSEWEAIATEERNLLGVNTDAELQNLLAIEASYEANARVMNVLRDLFDTLLRL